MKHHPDLAKLSAEKLHKSHIFSQNIVSFLAAVADVFALILVAVLSFQFYSVFVLGDSFETTSFLRYFGMLSIVYVGSNAFRGIYKVRNLIDDKKVLADIFYAWNFTFISFVALIFVMKVSSEFSRGTVILTYFIALPLLYTVRIAISYRIKYFMKSGTITPERVLVIGYEGAVERYVASLKQEQSVVKLVDMTYLPLNTSPYNMQFFIKKLANQARINAYTSVYLTISFENKTLINEIIECLQSLPTAVHLVPDEFLRQHTGMKVQMLDEGLVFTLSRPPLTPFEIFTKRLFDILVGSLILLIFTPILAVIAWLIRRESAGKAFFKQWRNGFNQTPFQIYKFRSMRVVEEGAAVKAAEKNDSRVTKVGAFLRRWNLDELPQLINVVKGNMSLVGPRPHPLNLDAESEDKVALYAKRFNIKPGMTGWAQVNGLRGSISSENSMKTRIDHDIWYMDNWSLWLDIVIMIKTVTSKKAFENAF